MKSFIPELQTYLISNQCRDWVTLLLTDILYELASFVCAAETEGIESQIQDEIDLLRNLFASNPNTEPTELESSKRLLDQCQLVFDFNRGTQEASEDLLAALLAVRPLLDTGIESSRSNWFFLTKRAQLATQPQLSSIPPELYDALNGQAISGFIAGIPDLDPQVAIRLRLLGAESDCRQSFIDFTHHAKVAIAKAKKSQQADVSPSPFLYASREHLDACLAHVADLTQECRENSDWHAELEEALFLRGSNMLLVAYESRRLSSEYQVWGKSLEVEGRQLLAEVRSLATARGTDENDPRVAFISMFEAKDYFSVPIDETATKSSIILLPQSHQTTTPDLSNLSPAEIVAAMESFDVVATSKVIAESNGLDDKLLPTIELDQIQYLEFLKYRVEFCTHLIGEWDPYVGDTLAGAYANRPEYICRCDKLGKQTTIPAPDAKTAFTSMVLNNCEGCSHREAILEKDAE